MKNFDISVFFEPKCMEMIISCYMTMGIMHEIGYLQIVSFYFQMENEQVEYSKCGIVG